MSDENERSVASDGSVDEPAWDAAGDRLPAGADKLLRIAELEAELAWLRAAVRALLDGVNKRYPNKHRNEWTCPHMAELDRLVPHDDGK